MAESIKLDTTVPAYAIARGNLVHFDICLKEAERRQLSERFAFIKLEDVTGKLALAQVANGCWELKGQINVAITTGWILIICPAYVKFVL